MKVSEDLRQRLRNFSKINEYFGHAFQNVQKNAKLCEDEKYDNLLFYLATEVFVYPQFFHDITREFPSEIPMLLHTALFSFNQYSNYNRRILKSILLVNAIKYKQEFQGYALKYFNSNPPIFDDVTSVEVVKKRKMQSESVVSDLVIVEICHYLLQSNPDFYRNKWNWSVFIKKYLDHENPEVRWTTCRVIAILVGMNEKHVERFMNNRIPPELNIKFNCEFNPKKMLTVSCENPAFDKNSVLSLIDPHNEGIVNISGIYIPVVSQRSNLSSTLVEVPSTKNNLRKIALALTSNRAICLQGPVGSGKTSLVEYLAQKTGRNLGEDFVKVQLGDETDGKMLLGTYRCTDIPGEFVWQPGVLTQAVLEGHWLLLEDIDTANMDIATILASLLENNTLTVPGYRDTVSVTPGFQLFLTQRFVSTISGHHKKHSNTMALLEKHVSQINIDPLAQEELMQILNTRYIEFRTITDRMLSVFSLFNLKPSDSSNISVPRSGRLISTRDFFKWCSRAIVDFDVKSQASALKVLQDAIDVFCCSFSDTKEALELAKQISTHLGIVNHKAEYFFNSYKPTMRLTTGSLIAGRATLQRENNEYTKQVKYSFTRPSAVLLERIMSCVTLKEPVLLVGETGTGKTSCVQYLAHTIGQKLVVINMNQQSDSADLLGGFKPVEMKLIVSPVRKEFEQIFCDYFKVEPNRKYLSNIALCFNTQRWPDMVKLMMRSYQAALGRLTKSVEEFELRGAQDEESVNKHDKDKGLLARWRRVGEKLQKLDAQLRHKSALAFAFIEGSLVRAVESGHWVLLDEINLANAETLECLSGLLEGSQGSVCLLERGDKRPVRRHPGFTLFACMNPSTDVGKKDLPAGLRNRFTEFFVDELNDKDDLLLLVNNYLDAMSLKDKELGDIVGFYSKVRMEAMNSLSDGLGHKPHFSLRSLCRALVVASKNPCGTFKRSLYEAFCLSFLTQLDSNSYQVVERMISSYLIGDAKSVKAVLKQPIPEPQIQGEVHLQFEGYWVRRGNLEPSAPEDYILTQSVRRNLKDLVRVVSIGKLPVLLQGDTSVGKTSLITYLARASGNGCVRINNHEHTDLQEYIGAYAADASGRLVFREGVLVEAMRRGSWVILDELNLAPSDVLEALNRVLDDNRELFIPETQQTVRADPNFMLFATQNPPGAYGGRKVLSRAFRNRFVELHFDEIPPDELEVILHRRCQMARSYAGKMISVMTELQMRRRGSAAFAGKQGFITLRDLFRWGERYRLAKNTAKLYDWDQHLADEGYLVLAGRVRRAEEKAQIIEVLQKHLKRAVVPENLFTLCDKTSTVTKNILEVIEKNKDRYQNIVWTYNMRQLAVLVSKALEFKEPVLLVGETGGGKTTVAKLIAENNGQKLVTVNCHMHTESSDFIGGLRPVRDHSSENSTKLFEWIDGPLIDAMVQGQIFLADEISLADDSVLERLNSLLEPERTLLLAEKGIDLNNRENSELIVANPNFFFIGTMNPGGDFGKKELSPALRNRFTEIWCETCRHRDDLVAIIERNIKAGVCMGNQEDCSSGVGNSIMDFVEWFERTEIGKRFTISIRDILTWVNFLNTCADKMEVTEAYIHGAYLTFLDSLGSGITSTESPKSLDQFKADCHSFLTDQVSKLAPPLAPNPTTPTGVENTGDLFGIKPFYIRTNLDRPDATGFAFNAPTTLSNALRLLRGMQLSKAVLLEGSPGVGKTSLVTALAKVTGHELLRVNLSDQTDVSDLFGADLPVEGGSGGQFSWRDGPLLQALKNGSWVLLDELNLASQSVLEGLNACLDHRGEIFVPELGKTFHVKPGTKFFGCQNPLKQGGSRRGLPQSFLNRFIQVYVSSLNGEDLFHILSNQFPTIPSEVLRKMIEFNDRLAAELDSHAIGNKGAPWECNLRDLTRWCEAALYLLRSHPSPEEVLRPENLVQLIYADRMRTASDRRAVGDVFAAVLATDLGGTGPLAYLADDGVHLGDVRLSRTGRGLEEDALRGGRTGLVLRSQLAVLRSLAYCVNLNWMAVLVGSSGCGKSGVVKTLANLAGKTLKTLPVTSAMDTTDILGGFEQTDYSRHLDEIAKSTERLSLETVQELIFTGRTQEAVGLIERWEAYRDVRDSANLTMEEEIRLFLRKLAKVEEAVMELKKYQPAEPGTVLRNLEEKLNFVAVSVKKEGSLNAGGKFEWVDSILVKCLQNGSWLLVDNVNLCSSAVLDRLNALLEPNGVLTISERGVDENGRMVEIKPHKDFRMFFTMDPKNGEISRAMRNRGIEIYIMNENETKECNELDRLALINLEGIRNTKEIVSLNKIHSFISDLVLGEKPTVKDLLQAASLIAQQINLDKSTLDVFTDTIIEVYYKTRSAYEFDSDDPLETIKNEVQQRLNTAYTVDRIHGDVYDDNLTLKTSNIRVSSKLEKVKQQAAAPLKYVGGDVTFELLHRFVNYYSISSMEDLAMRHCYIKSRLDDPSFHELFDDWFNALSSMEDTESGHLPLDNNWTPDTFQLGKNTLQSNKLNLALFLSSFYFLERHELKEAKLRSGNSKSVTLLDYMNQRELKKIEDKFNDVVIDNYSTLIKEFDKFLLGMTAKVTELSDRDTMHLCYLASWRFLLHKCTLTNIKSLTPAKQYDILARLSAHYKWFHKFSINQLSSVAKVDLTAGLSSVSQTINSKLDRHFSLMQKLGNHYQKHSDRPFIDAAPLAVISEYNDVKRCYDLCHPANNVVHILGLFQREPKLKPLLVEVKASLGYEGSGEFNRELRELHARCMGSDTGPDIGEFELKVLPLLDVFTQLRARAGILQVNPSMMANDVLVPPELSGALALYRRDGDQRLLPEITRSCYMYLMYSASSRPGRYLGTAGGDLALSCFSPRLAYYFSHLLVGGRGVENSTTITLGNFRELMRLHNKLSGVLWGNMFQLSEQKYDNLYTEKKRIIEIYEKLVEELFKSMKLDYSKHQPLQTLTRQLVDALRQWKHASTLPDPRSELQSFIERLERSSENLTKLQKCSDPNETLLIISDMYMELSYTKAILNSRLMPIDPLVKRVSKRDYCSDSISMFEGMKRCYEEQNTIYSGTDGTRHVYCEAIEELVGELERKRSKYVPYKRSSGAQYEPVLRAVSHAFSTILSEEHVAKTISTLNEHIRGILEKTIDRGRCAKTLGRHESMAASYENLVHEWTALWGSYPDVAEPLIGGVAEFLYGLRMKTGVLKKCLAEYEAARLGVDIDRRLLDLVRMPVLDGEQRGYESYLDVFVDEGFSGLVDHVLEDAESPYVKVEENFRLLKCGIQESFNNCVIDAQTRNSLTKETFLGFNNFINVFVNAYNKHQEEKEAKEKEEGNLYKIRTKCDDKTEEEQSEEELKELFPNYHGIDFADFQKNAVLSDELDDQQKELKHEDVISYDDLKELAQLHVALMNDFTKTEWLNPGKNKTTHYDFVRPLMEKFKTFAKILEKSVHGLDYTMDNKIIGSLSVLLAVTKSYGDSSRLGDQPTSPTRTTNKKTGDFYRDSNVEEVKSCHHILEDLKAKTNELLNEWPDQPTLKTIVSIIERVSSFDINSPVSRFLTGFEILLAKCHEWEQVAHSGVSLSQHHRSVTDQIISWRKLELAMWKDLLNRTYERANEPLAKWWLYLHNIMQQFIVAKQFPVQELIETLQTFLSKSSLAEFHGRLDLIRAFHCHATYLDPTKESAEFTSVLWNLHSYFQQFSPSVSAKIKELRSPTEKKLREYVKIVRWKDISYWAVRETVDRSHRTLHRYTREFREALQQPVTQCLRNSDANMAGGEYVGIWDRPQRQSPKTYHYTLDAEAYMAKQSLVKKISASDTSAEVEGVLGKIESYFLKSRKLCKEIILGTKYPSLVQSLDGFVTTVIETSSHLQNLEVDKNIPKEKQKGQAKSILQRKHRALADLFKTLSKIGVSFRTGIIENKLKNPASDFVFKPIDLNANFSFINLGKTEEKILTIWDSCELYYVRSLMRADVLETAMKNPAKDLGLQNIERCKGFSTNLLTLAQNQKSILIESTRTYSYLRYYSKQMNECCEGKAFLHTSTLENIVILLKNIGIVMNQYKMILNSCPEENIFDNETVPILETNIKERILQKHDALWSRAASAINELTTSSAKLSSHILKWKGAVNAVEHVLIAPDFVPVPDANVLESDLADIQDKLGSLRLTLGNTATTRSLAWLESETAEARRDLHSEHAGCNATIGSFKHLVEGYAEQMLLVMQGLFKKYARDAGEAVEEEQLGVDQLGKSLVGSLAADVALLGMREILRRTDEVAGVLLGLSPKDAGDHKAVAAQVMPVLEQLLHLYQYFITQQVSAYRVTCKMTSVLLNVFIELASKGFCVPPEFSDEMDDEGISKPSDGLGLGEGEGERDVSDKIESEDQLDDAQPAGQEKEKDEDGDCKEEEKGIEMSEDFDSKLQDKEKKEDDESESDSGDSDAEEQMGETEKGADQLDQEIWGSDKEEEGDDQDEGSEQKEEKGDKGEKEGEDQLGAKDESGKSQEETDDQTPSEEKEKNKKDINEMEEPEFDDDQIDPHHGNQPELPEPEPMDLPDDLQLDEGEEKDGENQEENPFDIDTMKEQNVPEEKNEDGKGEEDENKQDEAKDFSSDDEEITRDDKNADEEEEPKAAEDDPKAAEDEDNGEKDAEETKEQNEEAETADQGEDNDETGLDQTQSHQENVEAMDVDQAEATDKTQPNQSETQKSNLPIDEICQEDKPDQEGVGQSQMEESSSGHSAQTSAPQEMKSAREEQKEDQKRKQKPGESDSQRSLGDINEPVKKKLKTIDARKDEVDADESSGDKQDESVEMYQHIKDAKEAETQQVLDAATKEQAESQKKEAEQKEGEDDEDIAESSKDLPQEELPEEMEVEDTAVEKSEKVDGTKDRKTNNKQHPEGDVLEDLQEIEIEGEVVQTATVARDAATSHHTQLANIPPTTAARLSPEQLDALRLDVEQQLAAWRDPPASAEAEQAWRKISSATDSLARDLCEQLRLVLEPTQASRLRGDFRTGRRINMRKVVPYVASQFRKDRIWLRRTRPSKRDYHIVLAIDDSSSMADSRSRQLAFESVALVSRALALLETGRLSVVSFGEEARVLHRLADQFTDRSGVQLLQRFRFEQRRTCVAQLVDFATEMLGRSGGANARLLVVVSDGRGVFSEGETVVRQAVRRGKLADIFTVFVVIDNPENRSSVLDIRMPVFKDGKLVGIHGYMDVFPFSFYIILRDINSLPSVLSDALRQWFEIVSNLDK